MSDNRSFASRVGLGNELEVRRIGDGAMQLTGAQVWGEYPDRNAGIALLREVVELGITFIDTADV
jgi:pyridoxine 4-dehydrogenase